MPVRNPRIHGLQPWLHSYGAPRLGTHGAFSRGYTLTALRAWESTAFSRGYSLTALRAWKPTAPSAVATVFRRSAPGNVRSRADGVIAHIETLRNAVAARNEIENE